VLPWKEQSAYNLKLKEIRVSIKSLNFLKLRNKMLDIFERLLNNPGPIGQYHKTAHGYFTFPKLEGEIKNVMNFKNKKNIIWSLNNYLGLANNAEILDFDESLLKKYGLSYPMGSRMLSGETDFHENLEKSVAGFVKKDDATLFNFGYQGMVSLIDCICSRHDIIIYDEECHACIIDGIRLHTGDKFKFRNNNIEHLTKLLIRASEKLEATKVGGLLVITEGVFSMSGKQGKLKEIAKLKERFSFRLLVDDAHGFGIFRNTNTCTGIEQNIQDEIDLYFATFTKSFASIGAVVAGKKEIINYLRYNMRSQIFSKSLPGIFAASNLKRLEVIKNKPELRDNLWSNVEMLQTGLRKLKFDIGDTNSPITPIYFTSSTKQAMQTVQELRDVFGIFCSIITYPVIPKEQIIYRLIPTAIHTKDDIEVTLLGFESLKSKKRI
jgi:glycine C-acetyltransferase